MMRKVVEEGTGTPAQLGGIDVAGKTGTAEIGTPGSNLTAAVVHRLRPGPRTRRSRSRSPSSSRRAASAARSRRRSPGRSSRRCYRRDSEPWLTLTAGHDRSTGATRSSRGSAREGWPTCSWPKTSSSGRKVALKLLHRRFAEDPGFVERFRREAQAAAGLQHPNVVSVYDRGSFDDTYYIAMEYLPGRSLKQLIRQEAPIDPIRAIDITIQILKAARFAHRHGVIHRDLKPHNVIVDDADHAKVTDFGIARAGASDMTETGSIMGTAQYLSPEQAQGHAVSASSDLYSIGVVLYEMLTGARAVRCRGGRHDRAQARVRVADRADRDQSRGSRRSSSRS